MAVSSTASQPGSLPADRGQRRGLVAWAPHHELDAREWAAAGRRIGAVGRCVQWLLGDWIAYGNTKFGERYSLAGRITGYDAQTLMNMVYVASHFPISRRRENLSWSHHETLTALTLDEQDCWLDQAETHRWSVADLRMMVRASRREASAAADEHVELESGEADISAGDEEGHSALEPAAEVSCPRCGQMVSLNELGLG